jgi:CubicO group peptidase (beta-lactamase class C family)
MFYYPDSVFDWEHLDPLGHLLDRAKLEEVISFAKANESKMDRDIGRALEGGHFSEPLPEGEIIGPTEPREDPSGIIIYKGKILSMWGPVSRPDMTFSVTKSYLALCAGIAFDQGLIKDFDQTVESVIDDELFKTEQNKQITWAQLLNQTSEWEGELWDKQDLIDRNRDLNLPPNTPSKKGTHRDLKKPGEFWEYNDVRVNVLSYALLKLFCIPLPEILKEKVMDPIGASDTWHWESYKNAIVNLKGEHLMSVPGGAHWGGGLFISTLDHALMGLLVLREGEWKGDQLISKKYLEMMKTPCTKNPDYGFLWWLNQNKNFSNAASKESIFAFGVGRNLIWVDPTKDLVVVVRWLEKDAFEDFTMKVMDLFG